MKNLIISKKRFSTTFKLEIIIIFICFIAFKEFIGGKNYLAKILKEFMNYQLLFEKKIEKEFELNNRVNLNQIESTIPFGRRWDILNNYSNVINVGLSLDPKFILQTMITTASIIDSQMPTTKLRLHFSVVQAFKPSDMIKIYSLRDRLREDVEFTFYNASRVEKELKLINIISKFFQAKKSN